MKKGVFYTEGEAQRLAKSQWRTVHKNLRKTMQVLIFID